MERGDLSQQIIAEDYKQLALYWEQKYKAAVHFIEMTEALTYDPKTASRIANFLKEEGIWKQL